jgi:hypothetical protein
VILNQDERYLEWLIKPMGDFLKHRLKLILHSEKIIIRKLRQGIDFLGYVTLPYCRVIRTKTKRRALRLVNKDNLYSYLGICRHAFAFGVEQMIKKKIK